MAFINVATTGDFVRLDINASASFANASVAMDDTANVLTVPALQEVTVNATPGLFRWKQLDDTSEFVVTTPSTNSLGLTMVLDPVTFFDGKGSTDGIFDITNDKALVYFRMFWSGSSTGDRYIEGSGYLSALAPTVNPDSPVWTSPVTIEVVGSYTSGTVTP